MITGILRNIMTMKFQLLTGTVYDRMLTHHPNTAFLAVAITTCLVQFLPRKIIIQTMIMAAMTDDNKVAPCKTQLHKTVC